jgi:GntR family transcriptional repressor for pyruvate dehydrogenase complex
MSEPIKTPRLADAIAERLQSLVLEGVLRPGEKLISERELALKLGVSRPSLREALGLMEAKRLFVTGKAGTFVAPIHARLVDPLAELFRDDERVSADYFEFRLTMEAHAAGLAATRATETDRALIRDCLERMREAHQAGDPNVEAEVDVRLHVAIYEATHNVVILHVLRALAELLRQGVFVNRDSFYRRPGVRDLLLAQHVQIGEAVLAGDRGRAEAAAKQHVNFVRETCDEIRLDELRQAASLRRFAREDIVAG